MGHHKCSFRLAPHDATPSQLTPSGETRSQGTRGENPPTGSLVNS